MLITIEFPASLVGYNLLELPSGILKHSSLLQACFIIENNLIQRSLFNCFIPNVFFSSMSRSYCFQYNLFRLWEKNNRYSLCDEDRTISTLGVIFAYPPGENSLSSSPVEVIDFKCTFYINVYYTCHNTG